MAIKVVQGKYTLVDVDTNEEWVLENVGGEGDPMWELDGYTITAEVLEEVLKIIGPSPTPPAARKGTKA
jgi:hypothetical protein